MTTKALNREDPRYSRMQCDCCTRIVGWLRGSYPFYLCDDHVTMTDDEVGRLYVLKMGGTP